MTLYPVLKALKHRVHSQAIYLSQFQLIPYERVADYFRDQAQIPLSTGSIYNFNEQMYPVLQRFEDWVAWSIGISIT
jgi:transposase